MPEKVDLKQRQEVYRVGIITSIVCVAEDSALPFPGANHSPAALCLS